MLQVKQMLLTLQLYSNYMHTDIQTYMYTKCYYTQHIYRHTYIHTRLTCILQLLKSYTLKNVNQITSCQSSSKQAPDSWREGCGMSCLSALRKDEGSEWFLTSWSQLWVPAVLWYEGQPASTNPFQLFSKVLFCSMSTSSNSTKESRWNKKKPWASFAANKQQGGIAMILH